MFSSRTKPLLTAIAMICAAAAFAAEVPRPPCATPSPYPGFPEQGAPPNVEVWHSNETWKPPACTGWAAESGVLVALAGRFRFEGSADDLLRRFGAISTLRGIRYWSVTDHDWRTLITQATALDGPDLTRPRADFTFAEMKGGNDLYFAHDESRTSGEVIYRLQVRELTPNRVVVATENITSVTKLLLTFIRPGGLQSVHFLEREAPDIWTYYGLARATQDLTPLLAAPDASYVNRAAALYRHLIGIPTDRDRPLAP
jgi:uncharacterized protein DUF6675